MKKGQSISEITKIDREEIKFDEESFNRIEREILSKVMDTSKSIIESFKFRMIYCLNIEQSKINKTLNGLNEFRRRNWNNKLSRNKAYREYLSLY